jgi:hypothetical protein
MSALQVNFGTGNQQFDGGSSIAHQLPASPMRVFTRRIEHSLDVPIERPHDAAVLSVISAFVRRFEQIQRSVDLGDKALDLVALVGAGIFLQPF